MSHPVPAVSADALAAYLAAPDPAALILADVLAECAFEPGEAAVDAISAAAGAGLAGLPCTDPDDFALALAHASGREVALAQAAVRH